RVARSASLGFVMEPNLAQREHSVAPSGGPGRGGKGSCISGDAPVRRAEWRRSRWHVPSARGSAVAMVDWLGAARGRVLAPPAFLLLVLAPPALLLLVLAGAAPSPVRAEVPIG